MLHWITDLMNSLGYAGIVLLMFLENVFPPIPSEIIMPLAGYTTTQGRMSLPGVVAAGTLGSVLGALPLYYAGRILGEKRLKQWADRHGKWLALSGDDIAKAKSWFDARGAAAVFLCRLVPGVRSLISIPAGLDEMNVATFALYTALGAGLWSALLAYLGVLLGASFMKVDRFLGPIGYLVLGALLLAGFFWIKKRRRSGAG